MGFLTGKDEPEGLYKRADLIGPHRNFMNAMPCFIEQGYEPISIAEVIRRRKSAPAEVIDNWRGNSIDTGDGVAYNDQNDAKIVLDAVLLREVDRDSYLSNGALVFDDEWENLRGEGVLYLNKNKVKQANEHGFVKKNGVWQPENKVVGDIWEHLSREKDLTDYAEMVSNASSRNKVMEFRFNMDAPSSPVMQYLTINNCCGCGSYIDGWSRLDQGYMLVGVRKKSASRAKKH